MINGIGKRKNTSLLFSNLCLSFFCVWDTGSFEHLQKQLNCACLAGGKHCVELLKTCRHEKSGTVDMLVFVAFLSQNNLKFAALQLSKWSIKWFNRHSPEDSNTLEELHMMEQCYLCSIRKTYSKYASYRLQVFVHWDALQWRQAASVWWSAAWWMRCLIFVSDQCWEHRLRERAPAWTCSVSPRPRTPIDTAVVELIIPTVPF